MKPTQEQIDAALRYAAETDRMSDAISLNAVNFCRTAQFNALTILAAAYREAMAEIGRLNNQIEDIELEGDEIAEMRDYAD